METQTNFQSIFEALDIGMLTEDEQEELLLEIHDLVLKGTMLRLTELMDDDTRDVFAKLLDEDSSEEEIALFIKTHIPDADKALAETVKEITNDILAVTN